MEEVAGREREEVKARAPGCVFLVIGSLFPLLGAWMAEDQRHKFATWVEVPAQVVAQEIREHSDSDGDPTYGPVLKLRYLADGMPAEGEGLLAIEMSSSEGWAKEQLAPFPVGARITAWADPAHPERAFVVREASVIPYVLILVPMIFVCVGAMFLLFPPGPGKVYEPGTPWAARTFWIVWNGAGIAAAAHYFSQPGSLHAGGIGVFGAYLGIGFLATGILARRALSKP